MIKIDSVEAFDRALARGPYAWPGGYPVFFITRDNAVLSFETAQDNQTAIRQCIRNQGRYGWTICGIDINWECLDLYCEHSGERIEAAYGEQDK